ncbi:MAG: hypothetical protein IPK18_05020 [Sphingobacteriales bacterium]|nr:MAG: hypothetical protein IPK18_05020 [Sphingobacteriales bacterium]
MQYINPIEILGLSNVEDTTSIDNEIVRKAKRKLFADIDLSDNGLFEYYGLQLTKSDCEKVIDELTNNDLKEFYLYLATNKKLNSFLVNGNNDVFINFKQDSIFKLPEFIKFISPYFAPKFDKALLKAFESEDIEQTKSILKTSFLISQSEINIAYKSVSYNIQKNISEIAEIKNDIKNEESAYDEDDIDEVVDLVIEYFPSEILNCLPNYFQSQILKIANEINYLNVVIWDNFDNTQVCNDLLEHVLTLNIGGLDKPTFQKNYDIVRKKNQERIEQENNAPILRKYAGYLIQTKTKIKEIESKTTTPINLLSWVNSTISITDVNNLPSVFDEIKNQVALSLRAMSVEIWNSFSNIDVSIDLINKANNITGLKAETKQNLEDAKKQLTELKTKIDVANLVRQRTATPTQTRPVARPTSTSSKSNESNAGVWIILAVVIIGIIVWANSNKSSSSDYPTTTESYTPPATTNDNSYSNDNSTPATTNEYTPPVQSEYIGNQLKDGASPLTGCFGKGIYSGNATLTIKNGGNSDAIICLYSISDDRTIRNEYVQKNSSFTMSNIAQGEYKIRVFYGNDWNPELENSCGTKGNFESDVNFSEFDGTEYFEDSERGYTNATITLYTVANGNASSSSIDQSQFFRK